MNTLSRFNLAETVEPTAHNQGQLDQTLPDMETALTDAYLPYISVSGVASMADRVALDNILRAELTDEELGALRLLIGVQASTKSQVLGVSISRGNNWMPVRDNIWEPFTGVRNGHEMVKSDGCTVDQVKSALGLGATYLHFNPDGRFLTPGSLLFQLQGIFGRDPGHSRQVSFAENRQAIDGLQLNGLGLEFLSNPELISALRDLYVNKPSNAQKHRVPLIYQIGSSVLNTCADFWLKEAVEDSAVDTVLIDTSGGNGLPFDRDSYARIIADLQPFAHVGVAGGLGPDCLEDFEWLVDRFGPLSVDAESKLRDWQIPNNYSSSRFNPDKAADFVIGALEINRHART